jgi:hypothetical protein
MGPVTMSADLAAGLGGNLGVICPSVVSCLGDTLDGWICGTIGPPLAFVCCGRVLRGTWGCTVECRRMCSCDMWVGFSLGIENELKWE